jgi:hypothetical protein
MKKYIYASLIVLLGGFTVLIKLSYDSPYLLGLFENPVNYLWLLLGSFVLFLSLVTIFNLSYTESSVELEQDNLNPSLEDNVSSVKDNFQKIKSLIYSLNDNVRYYLMAFIPSLLLGVYFGFKFKKLGTYYLSYAMSQDTLWQKDLYVSFVKTESCFFCLIDANGQQDFFFNWDLFFGIIAIVMLISVVLKETILLDFIKAHILKKKTP